MSNSQETLVGITQKEFNYPYVKPLKPPPSSINTDTRLYLPRFDPDDCKCDIHSFRNAKARYKRLADKEGRLRDELIKINREMTNLTSLMLYSACNVNKTMRSVYKMDYEKRGLPVTQYRPLMAAVDSPIESPIMPAVINLKDAYRDPTRFFTHSTVKSPTIQLAETINLETCSFWDEPFTGCSEYMDTISKIGLSNMKNQQQYLKRLFPSRKLGGCNLPKR